MAKEMVYQNIIYRKSEKNCTMANIQLVKNVEEMNKK